MPRYRPVIVTVPNDGDYEVHLGQPGRPKVYRRVGTTIRRVEDELVLQRVAKAMREGVDRQKAAEEAEAKRRMGWVARFFRKIGKLLSRAWFSLMPK